MLLVSFAVLLNFILLDKFTEALYNSWSRYFSYYFNRDSALYKFFMSMDEDEFNNFINNITAIIVYLFSFIIVYIVLIFFLRRASVKTDTYIQNRVSFKFRLPENTAALVILGIAIVYACVLLSWVFDVFLGFFGIEKIEFDTPAFPKTVYGVILYFAASVIAPAFLEEFFCRYLILNSLKKYGGKFAIIVSAVFFGFLHGRTPAIFFAAAIGIYSAYIALKTKSIWFSIILHAAVNLLSVIWHYISELPFLTDEMFDILFWCFSAAIYLFSFVYLIILAKNKSRKSLSLPKHRDYVYMSRGRKVIMFFNVVTIIFLFLAILQAAQEYAMPMFSGGSGFGELSVFRFVR